MQNKDFLWQKFGRIEILDIFVLNKRSMAFCICDCGNTSIAHLSNIKRGLTKSCGCGQREAGLKNATTHGLSKKYPKEYRAWKAMKRRCDNKKLRNYNIYGGRGIRVCDRWLNCFSNFIEDMGPAPDGLTLDRINSDGNYEPENCKWSSYREQANNLRTNRIIRGSNMTAANFSRKYNIKYSTLLFWHNKKNMDASQIIKKLEQSYGPI